MTITLNNLHFKKIIVLFWTAWWLIALWTDIVGALNHYNILKASWAPDVNFPMLVKSLRMYHPPDWLPTLFYFGIIICSCVVTISFSFASLSCIKDAKKIWMRRAEVAFILGLTYWFMFLLADQCVMDFALEENHMVQAGFHLLTFIALYCLPE